ncbi:VWA domain-containing protein [Streptomyces sp. NPDC048523]|uniref:VWA domain-containing protein n=1 Tax=Streptomyces sp. NPDC048523 TaxID=3365567 RepID=UPI003713294E
MGILTLLRNAFGGRSRKGAATEAEGAVPSQEATEPKLPSPATEPTPPAATVAEPTPPAAATVPEPRTATLSTDSEHELVSAAFDHVAVPKQTPPAGADETAAEATAVETPEVEATASKAPAAEEPATETPVAETPAAEEPVAEVPVAETGQSTDEPAAEAESSAEEPTAEKPTAEEAAPDEPAADEPVAQDAAVEEPVAVPEAPAEKQVAEDATSAEPVAEEPVAAQDTAVEEPTAVPEAPAEEQVAEGTTSEEAPSGEPVAEEPVADEPVAQVTAVEEPAVVAAEAAKPQATESAPEPEPVAEVAAAPEPETAVEPRAEPEPEATPADGPAGDALAVPPTLRTAYDAAASTLAAHDLTGTTAKTYLVLDRSASMRPYYKDGSAQALGEQTLALAAHLDPESTVHVVFFSTELDGTGELTLAEHENKIDDLHAGLGRMGRTSYHAAVEEVLAHHTKESPDTPALVVFQTDGAPDAKTPATQALTEAAKSHPAVFFSFVAFGDPENKAFDYLRKLKLANTSHFLAGETPKELTDTEIYEGILANWRP